MHNSLAAPGAMHLRSSTVSHYDIKVFHPKSLVVNGSISDTTSATNASKKFRHFSWMECFLCGIIPLAGRPPHDAANGRHGKCGQSFPIRGLIIRLQQPSSQEFTANMSPCCFSSMLSFLLDYQAYSRSQSARKVVCTTHQPRTLEGRTSPQDFEGAFTISHKIRMTTVP